MLISKQLTFYPPKSDENRTIVEWIGGVLQSRNGHNHVWCENGAIGALDTFRLHLQNPTHSNSFLGYTINAVCTALPVKEQS